MSRSLRGDLLQFFGGKDRNSSCSSCSRNESRSPAGPTVGSSLQQQHREQATGTDCLTHPITLQGGLDQKKYQIKL